MNWLEDISLEETTVRLIPLEKGHRDALVLAAADGKLWELWHTSVPSEETVAAYISLALKQKREGSGLPFVVLHKPTNKIIGSTRFCNADQENRRLEIGYTWYSKSYQRSSVNTECKLLLLGHAFENLKCISVQFLTNWHNHSSRNAIARLGAKQDGILRNHRLNADGTYRDTVVFSIISQEWLNVQKSLKYALKSYN